MIKFCSILVLLVALALAALYRMESPTAIGLVDTFSTASQCVAGKSPLCDSSYPSRLVNALVAEVPWNYVETSEEIASKHLKTRAALEGKVAIVTGASAGLGAECARVLMMYGCHVIFAVRTPQKGQGVLDKLQAAVPGGKGTVLQLDTSDLESVKSFAESFIKLKLPLHFLIMNAGIGGVSERRESKQGHELSFATNNLGHFLLGRLLERTLLETGTVEDPARVVHVASEGQTLFANLGNGTAVENLRDKIPPQHFDSLMTYFSTKALNVLTAMQHQRRFGAGGSAIAASVHPGLVPTELFAKAGGSGFDALFFGPLMRPIHKTVPQGAATYLHVLLAREIPAQVRAGGSNFYVNNAIAKPNPDLLEPGVAEEGWRLFENLVAKWL